MKSLHSLWQVIQPFQMVSNGPGQITVALDTGKMIRSIKTFSPECDFMQMMPRVPLTGCPSVQQQQGEDAPVYRSALSVDHPALASSSGLHRASYQPRWSSSATETQAHRKQNHQSIILQYCDMTFIRRYSYTDSTKVHITLVTKSRMLTYCINERQIYLNAIWPPLTNLINGLCLPLATTIAITRLL